MNPYFLWDGGVYRILTNLVFVYLLETEFYLMYLILIRN